MFLVKDRNICSVGNKNLRKGSRQHKIRGPKYQRNRFSRTNVKFSKRFHGKELMEWPGLGGSSNGDGDLLQGVNRRVSQTDLALINTASLETGSRDWSQKIDELLSGQVHGSGIDDALLSVLEHLGGLLVEPIRMYKFLK